MLYVQAYIRDWLQNSEGMAAQRLRIWLGVAAYEYIIQGKTRGSVRKAANLPTSFKLFGRTWKVELRESLQRVNPNNYLEHLFGLCYTHEGLIQIARTVGGVEVTPRELQATLIHEFIHAALFDMGRKEYDDEDLVHGLEQMVMHYLETARGVTYNKRPRHG